MISEEGLENVFKRHHRLAEGVRQAVKGWELKEPETTMHTIGKELLSNYVIPFEVASVLLLSAMVGAILFTRSEPGEGED